MTVDRPAERIDHAADHLVAHGHGHDLPRAAHAVAFLQVSVRTEQDDADVLAAEVHDHAAQRAVKGEQLAGHDIGHAAHAADAVGQARDDAGLEHVDGDVRVCEPVADARGEIGVFVRGVQGAVGRVLLEQVERVAQRAVIVRVADAQAHAADQLRAYRRHARDMTVGACERVPECVERGGGQRLGRLDLHGQRAGLGEGERVARLGGQMCTDVGDKFVHERGACGREGVLCQHSGGRRRDAADGRVAYAVLHVAAQLRLGLRYAAAYGLGLARGLGVGSGGVGLGLRLCLGKLGVCLSVGSLLRLGDVLGGVACLILRVRRAAERVGNAVAALLKELADLLAREENQRQRQQQEVEDGADGSQKIHSVGAPFRFISFMVQPSCVGATHWRICAALRSAVSLPSRPPVSAVTSSGSFASTAAAAAVSSLRTRARTSRVACAAS